MKYSNCVKILLLVLLIALCEQAFALSVISPANGSTLPSSIIDLQYVANGDLCTAIINDMMFDIPGCLNITLAAQEGENNITVRDGLNEISFIFFVRSPDAAPVLTTTPGVEMVADLPADDINPLADIFGPQSVSAGAVTADKAYYSYPVGVSFVTYVKVRNTGSDPTITVLAGALHSEVVKIERMDVTQTQELAPYTIRQTTRGQDCSEGTCIDVQHEQIVDVRQQSVRRYQMQKRPLVLQEGSDARISRIRARDRLPPNAKTMRAGDTVRPGEDAVYAVTFRAGMGPLDEFYINAVSPTMAEGLDPFINTNWTYARNITINESFGILRNNQLVRLNVSFGDNEINNCSNEIRVSNTTLDDVPVRILDDGGNLSTGKYCTFIFGATTASGINRTYYVYSGNPTATAPAAATDMNRFYNISWTAGPVYFPTTDFGTAGDATDLLTITVADYDCNSVVDVIYGIDDGLVYFLNNTNTNASPTWAVNRSLGFDVGSNSQPELAHLFNGTFNRDLIVGENAGNLNFYENTGTCQDPTWVLRTVDNGSIVFNVDSQAAARDLDGDSLVDIIIGASTGRINTSKNINTTSMPAFSINAFVGISNVSNTSSPTFADFNFDGLWDIVRGDSVGNIRLSWNNGTRTNPSWGPNTGTVQRYNTSGANIDVGSRSSPAIQDLNADGWDDLIIGEQAGFISIDGAVANDGKYLINAPLNISVLSINERPIIIDMDLAPDVVWQNHTLNCSINITDDSSEIFVNFTWFRNNTINNSLNTLVRCQNATLCSSNTSPNSTAVGNNWTCRAFIIDTPWQIFENDSVNITYTSPNVSFLFSDPTVVLNAGFRKIVTCNASIMDFDGNTTIRRTNATLYLNGTSPTAVDSNVSHYTNLTGRNVSANRTTINVSYSFPLMYYAANGTWICNVTVNDTYTVTHHITTFNIDPLFAINITSTNLSFGNIGAGYTSSNITENFTNIGNQPLNVTVYGYGTNPGDNSSFSCPGNNNISYGYMRYSFNISAGFDEKENLTANPIPINVFVGTQINSTIRTNISYWQAKVPELFPVTGVCNGTIIFEGSSG
jgi:hypothetical protein